MSSHRIVPVSLSEKSYEIEVGSGNLDRIGALLAEPASVSTAVVLTDRHVFECGYATRVAESIAAAEIDASILSIAPGEQSKIIETAASLWNTLLEDGVDRKAVLVAVGGGVVGDLGGFVAATYARGIRFFQVPTSLLAQVDSSVGGKVGIDLPAAKNMVGAFLQPKGVLIDTELLATLPEEQYRAGLGEVFKYGVSLDAGLFAFLEENAERIRSRDNGVLRHLVAECCRIKAEIVERDEFEQNGRRALLNYGHTFAHAFEIFSEYRLPHGMAVAVGSIFAARLAERLGLVDADCIRRHRELCLALNLPTELPWRLSEGDGEKLLDMMRRDKKTEFGRLRFVLPTGPGRCRLVEDVAPKEILTLFSAPAPGVGI